MGASFFKAIEYFAEAFGALQEIAEKLELIITECTGASHPDAVGIAFRSISEAPADSLFEKYLSVNSSQHLEYHYASVRDSMTPVQLAGFDQSLRDTIGGGGTVALGGVGVIALSLAMLFDLLASQMKGENTQPDPIKEIFNGEGEALLKMRTSISDCLNRLPKSANKKRKMKLDTRLCQLQVRNTLHNYTLEVLEKAQTTGNYIGTLEKKHLLNAYLLYAHLTIHYHRIKSKEEGEAMESLTATDDNAEKMLLLYAFAPNVTYAMQNWEQNITNMAVSCVKPQVLEFVSALSKSQTSQTTYVLTLRNRKELINQSEDFVMNFCT